MMKGKPLSEEIMVLIAERFKVLGEPVRLRILHFIGEGEKTVNEIAAGTGTSQPNVSKHLRVMQESGLLKRRQEKNFNYYSVADVSIFEMCDTVCNSLRDRLETQSKLLALV